MDSILLARGRIALLTLILVMLAAACTGESVQPPLAVTAPPNPSAPLSPLPTATAALRPSQTLATSLLATATPPLTATSTVTATSEITASATATVTAATPAAPPTPTVLPSAAAPAAALPRTVRVPILMYHYLSQPPANANAIRRDLSVAPARFEAHLAYLQANGYHVITLDDLLAAMMQGQALPEKPVIITFDDGYEDNYTNAFPLLKRYGMAAYFFILTDVVNEGRAGYLTWPQIEEMAAAGQHFGAHGRNHDTALRGQTKDFLVWHALGTAEAIQQHLGYHPRWVAYPSGAYDALTIAVFRSAGFVGGLSTEAGATHSPDTLFHLSRIRVRGTYSADTLGQLLNADW